LGGIGLDAGCLGRQRFGTGVGELVVPAEAAVDHLLTRGADQSFV
jgi:hypothetical protein